jgi:hypothetical protein
MFQYDIEYLGLKEHPRFFQDREESEGGGDPALDGLLHTGRKAVLDAKTQLQSLKILADFDIHYFGHVLGNGRRVGEAAQE